MKHFCCIIFFVFGCHFSSPCKQREIHDVECSVCLIWIYFLMGCFTDDKRQPQAVWKCNRVDSRPFFALETHRNQKTHTKKNTFNSCATWFAHCHPIICFYNQLHDDFFSHWSDEVLIRCICDRYKRIIVLQLSTEPSGRVKYHYKNKRKRKQNAAFVRYN